MINGEPKQLQNNATSTRDPERASRLPDKLNMVDVLCPREWPRIFMIYDLRCANQVNASSILYQSNRNERDNAED